jgi:hypothetical protein
MPEQLTKYPAATLQVLRSAGARCGDGSKPELLPACPPAQLCKLPGGEICVYGLADAASMTQLTAADWRAVQLLQKADLPARHSVPFGTLLIAIVMAGVVGMLLHAGWRSRRDRQRLRRARHSPD